MNGVIIVSSLIFIEASHACQRISRQRRRGGATLVRSEGGDMTKQQREVVGELYKTLVLLGADNDLLGTVGSWGGSLPDEDVLANLKAWNKQTLRETTQRIEQ
jgi:hypothetical protein